MNVSVFVYSSKYNKNRIVDKKIEAEQDNKFYCTHCHNAKEQKERALNLDGTPSILCLDCKEIERDRTLQTRVNYNDAKLEFILQHKVSCQKCECIFLKPPDDGYICIKIQTYKRENNRYVKYNGDEYHIDDFLKLQKDNLELRIIQFDHLTENEQRERGILLPDEEYIPKTRNVSYMSSKSAVKLESIKCQNLCAKCHVEETIEREIGKANNSRSYHEREKLDYVNNLKNKFAGCSICKFWDPTLIRFFDTFL